MTIEDHYKSSIYLRYAKVGEEVTVELKGQETAKELTDIAMEKVRELKKENNGGK